MYRLELLGFRDVADDVASRSLAKAFGIGIDEAARWVSSAPVKVRSNVDVETASEYAGALVRIGADVLVRNNETGDEKVYRGRDVPVTAPNAKSPFSSHAPPTNPQSAITPEHPADSGAEGAFETEVNPAIYESSGWDTAEVADMSADPVPGPATDMDGDALTRPIAKVGGDAEREDYETAEPTVEREFSSLPTDDLDWVAESTKRDPSADDLMTRDSAQVGRVRLGSRHRRSSERDRVEAAANDGPRVRLGRRQRSGALERDLHRADGDG